MSKRNPVRPRRSRSSCFEMISTIMVREYNISNTWRQASLDRSTASRYAEGMKVLVLYRPNSEHGRSVEDFIRDYQSRHGSHHFEVLNIDSRDGSATATLYDVVQYPAILVLQDDGYVQKMWEGGHLPLMDDVAAYASV